ncbi:MAG: FMN-binding protein [Kiritimatiellae bacterium]|nr:FMN-binding protein [Kiritimatiellia bacterium]
MGGDGKVIGFAAIICIVCSLGLSAVNSSLKPRQDHNKLLDLRSKVLQAFGVPVANDKGKRLMSDEEIASIFESAVTGFVLDSTGNMVTNKAVSDLTVEEINGRDLETKLKQYYPYFVYTNPESGGKRYAIHVSGMGLWSVVKGYLALESDQATIAGLAVYDHLETPGLGGDVDKKWFLDQFKGKEMITDGKINYFRVLKPSAKADHASVNGPSGATMTSNGMTKFINSDFKVYNAHFSTLKGS